MSAKYTVNEVEDRTSVPATTLRQWERRYGFPMPARSESGYRLYSDRDLEQIRAMKRYIADGVPASRAASLVKNTQKIAPQTKATEELAQDFLAALLLLSDSEADRVLSEAYALHPLEKVLLEIIRPSMIKLGEKWHAAEITTTTEHFASSYVQGKLRGLFALTSPAQQASSIIIACAPGDQHELGALMLAVLLRRQGYRVYYLGANTPVPDLLVMAQDMKPLAVMISASISESVSRLFEHKALLQGMLPLLILGGAGFDARPELAADLGGIYLSGNLEKAVERFAHVLANAKVKA